MNQEADLMLADTRRAFDAVADEYDGPSGNNELIRYMRGELLASIMALVPVGAHLLDLGCGTGIDAAFLGRNGYQVTAIDWSPAMVAATRRRIASENLEGRVSVLHLGIHQLHQLSGRHFDAAYSDLGPLNCVPDLHAAAPHIASVLAPRGVLIASVINRDYPWEILNFAARGDIRAARRRYASAPTPVGLGAELVWTRYYRPKAFARELESYFTMEQHRALCWLTPPPYLVEGYQRLGGLRHALARSDAYIGRFPLLRDIGDHFLAVMRVRESYSTAGGQSGYRPSAKSAASRVSRAAE